jgi:hypothetical protein
MSSVSMSCSSMNCETLSSNSVLKKSFWSFTKKWLSPLVPFSTLKCQPASRESVYCLHTRVQEETGFTVKGVNSWSLVPVSSCLRVHPAASGFGSLPGWVGNCLTDVFLSVAVSSHGSRRSPSHLLRTLHSLSSSDLIRHYTGPHAWNHQLDERHWVK